MVTENVILVVSMSIVENEVIIVRDFLGLIENEVHYIYFGAKYMNCGKFKRYLLQLWV
jgi:hypothetical protein